MAQLADRVRQVKRLKVEKARTRKFHKKDKVAYIEADERDYAYDVGYEEVEDNIVNMAELKPGPPYVCKLLKSFEGKNSVEQKMTKLSPKCTPLT